MAKLYIQGVRKDFCTDFTQKQMEFLAEYRAEIDPLYLQTPADHQKIDRIQNNIDLIEERSLKETMVGVEPDSLKTKKPLPNSFMQQNLFFKKNIYIYNSLKSGKIATTNKDILKTAHTFYEELYKKTQINNPEQDKVINNYDKKISDNWHRTLKENFTEEEIYNSLKYMSEDSAPGKDGLPMEFYQTF